MNSPVIICKLEEEFGQIIISVRTTLLGFARIPSVKVSIYLEGGDVINLDGFKLSFANPIRYQIIKAVHFGLKGLIAPNRIRNGMAICEIESRLQENKWAWSKTFLDNGAWNINGSSVLFDEKSINTENDKLVIYSLESDKPNIINPNCQHYCILTDFTGSINGNESSSLDIDARITGNISTGDITLRSKAIINGDILSNGKMLIEEGAQLNGTSRVKPK